ncbi:MAG TPA: ChaN family lipoprotein [Nannocystaceae bacterium]|nr:ChaN family lipoprotein [Nannocystaceae bacterium]
MRRVVLAFLLAGCSPQTSSRPPGASPVPPIESRAEDPVAERIRILDREGHEVSLSAMLDALAQKDAVFLGETHLDDVTHRVELAVLEGLADRRKDELTLSLEMFERDVQPLLDDYLHGKIDEAKLVADARPWGNYATDYRPLVEAARARKLPVVAANLPRPLVMSLAQEGKLAWERAKQEHPTWVPAVVHPPDPEYWARVGRVLRGHGPGGGGGPEDPTWSIQNLWDNTMGEAVANALGERTVLHVVGAFHVEYFGGTLAQLRTRAPKASIASLTVVPVDDLRTVEVRPELADYVVYAQSYARGVSSGTLGVTTASELDYRLALPEHTAADAKLPLLVWLPDDGEDPKDAALRWKLALGGQAAVAVLVPPHRQREPDGRIVGRWGHAIGFAEDQRGLGLALERLLEYARRRLPVATDRIVIAGRGGGGASVLWAGLYGEALDVPLVAIAPSLPRVLQRASIPERKPGAPSLTVIDGDPTRAAMTAALEPFGRVGLTPTTKPSTTLDVAEQDAIRSALGVQASPTNGEPTRLRLDDPTAVGRRWAELYAALLRSRGTAAEVVATNGTALDEAWLRESFTDGKGLPRPDAAFGGATLIVWPERASKATRVAWQALVDAGAKERGMFSPVRLVETRELARAVEDIAKKGTSNVLVVPLAFAASDARMRALQDAVGTPPESIDVHFSPGLGGAAVHQRAKP